MNLFILGFCSPWKSGTVHVYLQLRNQKKVVVVIRDTEILTPAEGAAMV